MCKSHISFYLLSVYVCGEWSVGEVFTRDMLGCKEYLQKLLDQVLESALTPSPTPSPLPSPSEEASHQFQLPVRIAGTNGTGDSCPAVPAITINQHSQELLTQLEEARRMIQFGEERADILRAQVEDAKL